MREERIALLKAEFTRKIRSALLPDLLLPDVLQAAVDGVLKVDRNKIIIETMKEFIDLVESSTLEEVANGK